MIQPLRIGDGQPHLHRLKGQAIQIELARIPVICNQLQRQAFMHGLHIHPFYGDAGLSRLQQRLVHLLILRSSPAYRFGILYRYGDRMAAAALIGIVPQHQVGDVVLMRVVGEGAAQGAIFILDEKLQIILILVGKQRREIDLQRTFFHTRFRGEVVIDTAIGILLESHRRPVLHRGGYNRAELINRMGLIGKKDHLHISLIIQIVQLRRADQLAFRRFGAIDHLIQPAVHHKGRMPCDPFGVLNRGHDPHRIVAAVDRERCFFASGALQKLIIPVDLHGLPVAHYIGLAASSILSVPATDRDLVFAAIKRNIADCPGTVRRAVAPEHRQHRCIGSGGGLVTRRGGFAIGGSGFAIGGGGFAIGGGGLVTRRGGFAIGGGSLVTRRSGFAIGGSSFIASGGGFVTRRGGLAIGGGGLVTRGGGFVTRGGGFVTRRGGFATRRGGFAIGGGGLVAGGDGLVAGGGGLVTSGGGLVARGGSLVSGHHRFNRRYSNLAQNLTGNGQHISGRRFYNKIAFQQTIIVGNPADGIDNLNVCVISIAHGGQTIAFSLGRIGIYGNAALLILGGRQHKLFSLLHARQFFGSIFAFYTEHAQVDTRITYQRQQLLLNIRNSGCIRRQRGCIHDQPHLQPVLRLRICDHLAQHIGIGRAVVFHFRIAKHIIANISDIVGILQVSVCNLITDVRCEFVVLLLAKGIVGNNRILQLHKRQQLGIQPRLQLFTVIGLGTPALPLLAQGADNGDSCLPFLLRRDIFGISAAKQHDDAQQ